MDQNQSVDNDLQKAIDDITNTTNTDPVFSDPVAAPSSIPDGDTGELGEPIGPFPEPPKVQTITQAPEPIAPLEAVNIPEFNLDTITTEETTSPEASNLTTQQIKEAALRDLIPILDRLKISPSQKFRIYRDAFEDLHDYTILEPAYKIAKEMADEDARAEALFSVVEAIDKM